MARMSLDEKKFFAGVKAEALFVISKIDAADMHPLTHKLLAAINELQSQFFQLILQQQKEDKENEISKTD